MQLPPAPSLEPELPATVGRYEVRGLVGEGSMGRVLLAHDPVLDRDVAVKHLRSDLKIPREVRDGLLTRMRHEARAAARVAHPNLVVLHDMGEDDEVGLYLVFEYVEGLTLKQRIAAGRMEPAEVARLARELGSGLSVAHDAGILHRDVKPENVILARYGGKIADFGIARIPDSTLTHQGGLMGTPAYSAPETFRAGKFSAASDQFSLATTLYEALSGQRAFPGDDAVSVAARIAHESADAFAATIGLPIAVDEVFARALARTPEDRFASCTALGEALAEAIASESAVAPVPAAAAIVSAAAPTTIADEAPRRVGDATAAPSERKAGQVLLGALVVVVTAMLLVRAALQSAEDTSVEDPPPPPAPIPAASASAPRPHVTPPHLFTPRPTRRRRAPPRPRSGAPRSSRRRPDRLASPRCFLCARSPPASSPCSASPSPSAPRARRSRRRT